MLAMSPLLPKFAWEHPIDDIKSNLHLWNLDHLFIPSISTLPQEDYLVQEKQAKQSKSPQSLSSTDNFCQAVSSKKLNHNESERNRRKKINSLYSSLRALLPHADYMKKLSIPATVAKVLKYIPELQKEVEDLIHKKEHLLSQFSTSQEATRVFNEEIKPIVLLNNATIQEKSSSCSISVNILGDNEIVIQISTLLERISMPKVLLMLEDKGLQVLDMSSFKPFGGSSTFYNIHLSIEETRMVNCEKLKEDLLNLIQKQKNVYKEEDKHISQSNIHATSLLYCNTVSSLLTTMYYTSELVSS